MLFHFFIERGVGYTVALYNPKWITLSGLIVFLVFFISELFLHNENISGITSAALFILYSIRLIGWYTPGIWKKSLLWSLYLAMLFINIGFLLFALSTYIGISKFLALHAFAYGGIGVITLGMMARVTIGHTGRDINSPPATLKFIFSSILTGALLRVLLPLFAPEYYSTWIISSQLLWIVAFLLFIVTYAPLLIRPRIDGQPG